jgi:Zn-dependent peptidase ImmA (M78 family)
MSPQDVVDNILDELNIHSQSEINDYLEEIVWTRGVIVREAKLEGAEARLTIVGNEAIATISERVKNAHRRRFAIAHELGHFEMHRDKKELFIDKHLRPWITPRYRFEREANEFASAFLMPRKYFALECYHETPSLEFMDKLSHKFNASLTATSLRFLKFTNQPVSLIFSSEKREVKWRHYSGAFKKLGLSIPKGFKPSMRTETANTFDSVRRIRKVPIAEWFDISQLDNEITSIKEQAWLLGGKNKFILTLLWIEEPLIEGTM